MQILKEEEHNPTHEHIMSALVNLASDHAAAREKCLSVDLDLRSFLCQRIRFLEGKEPFQVKALPPEIYCIFKLLCYVFIL